MDLKTKTIEYNFKKKGEVWQDGFIIKSKRTATIVFEIKNSYGCYWQFAECKYSGLSETYTEEDWDFLKEVADKIKELKKELNK